MMKYALTMLMPIYMMAQAHLGYTVKEVMDYHPDAQWQRGITNDGYPYLIAEMSLGRFIYYFGEDGYTALNLQIPYNVTCVNKQIEIYNKKYVKVSETYWKAYLDNGYVMDITMEWDDELQTFIFRYVQ